MVTCRCAGEGLPQWSFCDDDLFCPQCGQPIAGLCSENQFPSNSLDAPIWVYPQRKASFNVLQYVFPLALAYADTARHRRYRKPTIDFDRCSVEVTPWFENRLAELPSEKGRLYHCRLIRNDEERPGMVQLDERDLPAEGYPVRVHFIGDFGRRDFLLRVCNTPRIVAELVGRGVEQCGEGYWQLLQGGPLELDLIIRSPAAPVVIDQELTEVDALRIDGDDLLDSGIPVQLRQPLPAGTEITPDHPWSSKIWLDGRSLHPGDRCDLLINLRMKFVTVAPLALRLERVDKGQIDIYPRPLTVDVMYLGECRSNDPDESPEGSEEPLIVPKMFVNNTSEETVRLKPPQIVRVDPDSPIDWLSASWNDTAGADSLKLAEDGGIVLGPFQQAVVYLRVDLSDWTLERLTPSRSLQAEIRIADQREAVWSVQFRLTEVRPRQPLASPLAVDFGNSHSFAALRDPGGLFSSREWTSRAFGDQVIPVHDRRQPESYPTALFFVDLSDPQQPEYLVGHRAWLRGQAQPHALVTDLKRWIGVPSVSQYREVTDASGERTHRYDLATLIHFYLKGLIQQVEAIVRQYRITRIGLCYPSRFTPERRHAYQQVLDEFRGCSQRDEQMAPLTACDLIVDEANAAAISFVFDGDVQRSILPKVVCPEKPSFVAASFDLGGGSLDTALLRFEVQNAHTDIPVFRSEYLGVGGDEQFGGDNVTVAVFELLCERIVRKLTTGGLDGERLHGLIPRPSTVRAADRWGSLRYHAIWRMAEEIKLYRSRCANGDPNLDALSWLRNLLQIQIINGLLHERATRWMAPQMCEKAREVLQESIDADELLVDLSEVYDHQVRSDMWGKGGYTVRQRIDACVDELARFARRRGERIHFVLLSGSGCRLPLVGELVKKLEGAEIVFDPRRSKCRVAFGLARYLDIQNTGVITDRQSAPPAGSQSAFRHSFADSGHYTSRPIGLRVMGTLGFIEIIPACSPINDPKAYEFRNGEQHLPVGLFIVGNYLPIYRANCSGRIEQFGWFDLSEPPTSGQQVVLPCEAELPQDAHASLYLLGSETAIELRLERAGRPFGTWTMRLGVPPADR